MITSYRVIIQETQLGGLTTRIWPKACWNEHKQFIKFCVKCKLFLLSDFTIGHLMIDFKCFSISKLQSCRNNFLCQNPATKNKKSFALPLQTSEFNLKL